MNKQKRSLAQRFYLLLFLFFVVGTLAWGSLVARHAGAELTERSELFIVSSSERVDEILTATADRQAELMDRAVGRLSENLGREFADVPFDVFQGREDQLLSYLRERLGEAEARHQMNSRVIADIFRDEAHRSATAAFDGLVQDQEEQVSRLSRSLSRNLLLWGGAFLVGLSFLLGFVFHSTVVKPLRTATEVFEAMRTGDMSRRLPPGEGEEIERLAQSFNAMAADLENYQRDLEGRVAEKTEALTMALSEQTSTNDKLRQTVAELENTQNQLVESAKMAALGTMARGMAHEFNNILGGISGCAADLAEDIEDEDARRVLDVIERSSRRALVITENLLSFSRGSQHGRSRVRLRTLLDHAAALVEPEASRRGVRLAIAGEDSEAVLTDGRGLQQVLLNLLINAVQASESGSVVEGRYFQTGEVQGFEIRDQGEGIEASQMDHIFEPFYSTKEQEAGAGGTGLGLSVARGIVEKLPGRIEVESRGKGQGSCFRVVFPIVSSHD